METNSFVLTCTAYSSRSWQCLSAYLVKEYTTRPWGSISLWNYTKNHLPRHAQNELWPSITRPATLGWFSLHLNWKIWETQTRQWTALDCAGDSVQTDSSGVKHHSLQAPGKKFKGKAQVQYPNRLSYWHLLPLPVSTAALFKSPTHLLPAAYSSLPTLFRLFLG